MALLLDPNGLEAMTEESSTSIASVKKPSPAQDLRRFFDRKIAQIKRRVPHVRVPMSALKRLEAAMGPAEGRQSRKDISEAFQQNLLKDIELDSPFREHLMTLDQLQDIYPLSRINTDNPALSLGLNDDEADIRLDSSSERNLICPVNRRGGRWYAFLRQFRNTFRLLLLMATVCCLLIFALEHSRTNELAMAIILFLVLVAMCVVSYFEELKTIKQVSGFQSMIPIECTVVRTGRRLRISAADLVLGDLVWIAPGDRVPADLRLLIAEDLQLETSWLSGEVEPLIYTDEPAPEGVGVFESQNVVFKGCSVTAGKGFGIVIRVGNKTVLGNLVELTSRDKGNKSPLEREHHRFVLLITATAVAIAGITFLLGLILNGFGHIVTTFVNGFLVVMVACVPQGLPVTLTAQLLIVARRLSKFGVHLKRLELADSLGLTSILMVDKTAVFTQNDLKVTDLWTHAAATSATDLIETHRTATEQERKQMTSGTTLQIPDSNCNLICGVDDYFAVLVTVMSVCDKAQIQSSAHPIRLARRTPSFRRKNIVAGRESAIGSKTPKQHGNALAAPQFTLSHKDLKEKSVIGKPMDVALTKFAEQLVSVDKVRHEYEVVYEVPFSSQRRFHLMIVCGRDSRCSFASSTSSSSEEPIVRFTLMIKGAPEEVIQSCSHIATAHGAEPLDDDKMLDFEKAFLHFSTEGKSCLGFAMLEFEDYADTEFLMDPAGSNFPDEGWCFLGMTALADPPLPDVPQAIRAADQADIKVFMISGDHPAAAEALAREMHFDFGPPRPNAPAHSNTSTISIASKSLDLETIDLESQCNQPRSQSPSSISTNSIRIDPVNNLEVVRGETVKELSKTDWARLMTRRRVVFARTTPKQKMQIVRSCQHRDAFVAVTGDGVMDAPALKQADVGLALEAVGSIFAKEAADIVLTRPQLPNLIAAVAHARLLFDNLKKTIAYSLSHLLPEMFPVWFSFVFAFPLGLSSLQILTIDLVSEIPPSIALVFEPAERDLMSRSPRKKNSRLVTRALLAYSFCFAGLIISIGCVFAYLTVFWSYGISLYDLGGSSHTFWQATSPNLTLASGAVLTTTEQVQVYYEASAAWHITLVVSQAMHLWMCTTRRISLFRHGIRNWTLVAAVAVELGTLLLVIFAPGVQDLLQVRPPAWYIWLFPLLVGTLLLAFNETRKHFIRTHPKHPVVRLFKW